MKRTTILSVVVLTLVAAAPQGYGKPQVIPTEAFVRLAPPTGPNGEKPTPQEFDRYKRDVSDLARSPQVLLQALADPAVQQTIWYILAQDKGPDKTLSKLAKAVKVTPVDKSDLVAIGLSVDRKDPRQVEEAPVIINAVAQAFVDEVNRPVTDQMQGQAGGLSAQREQLTRQIAAVDAAITQAAVDAPPSVLRDRSDALLDEMQALLKQITQLQAAQSHLQATMQAAQTQPASSQSAQPAQTDPVILALQSAEAAVQAQRDQAARNPDAQQTVKELDVRLAAVRQELARRQAELAATRPSPEAPQELRIKYAAVTEQLKNARQRYDQAVAQRRGLNERVSRVDELESQKKDLEARVAQIDGRLGMLKPGQVDPRRLPAMLAQRAGEPLEPTTAPAAPVPPPPGGEAPSPALPAAPAPVGPVQVVPPPTVQPNAEPPAAPAAVH